MGVGVSSGKLIVIEGGDGLGKSTQFEMLKRRIEAAGRRLTTFDFPNKSGNPIALLIRDFLRGEYGEVPPEFLGLAFAADRLVCRDEMLKSLDRGDVVLCDRYVLSNMAFQCAKTHDLGRRENLRVLLDWFEYEVMDLPKPGLQIIFTASEDFYTQGAHLARTATASREYSGGLADVHEASSELQVAVNAFFSDCPVGTGVYEVSVLDSSGNRRSVDDLHAEIWQQVSVLI